MRIQGFRGNCDSQASWGCAPALPNRIRMIFLGEVFSITSRRQWNPCAILLAHGAGGEKSDSFSRQGEQDRPVLWNLSNKQISCNCSRRTVATEIFLGKTIFNVRQKGFPPLLLPASVLQLPRCLARIYNLDSYHSTLFELESFKKCNCSRENRLQNPICFANVGYSPTPRQHFWKTAAPKNFYFAYGSYLAATCNSFLLPFDTKHLFHE